LAGANPNRRDSGRSLCAEEWARFCGCHNCADAIAKYIRSNNPSDPRRLHLAPVETEPEAEFSRPRAIHRDQIIETKTGADS